MNQIRQYTAFRIALAGVLMVLTAAAWGHPRPNDVDIDIITDDGAELPQYPAPKHGLRPNHRRYIEARRNRHYSIRIHNRTNRRIGVVIAVDGRNIISGKKSHLESDERMYILGPYQHAVYIGWRTGRNRANRFYFTNVDDSYANAWGDRSAMGIIAVASYREKTPLIKRHRQRKYKGRLRGGHDAPASKNAPGIMAERQPGTGFGGEEWSPSYRVHFELDPHHVAKYFLKYEWRQTLCMKGIVSCDHPHNRFWPKGNHSGFAPHPPTR